MIKNITDKNLILFGVGAVQKCILHYIDKYFKISPHNMLMIDLIDYSTHPDIQKWIARGAKYLTCDINKEYKTIIQKLNEYDIILDLTNRTESNDIIEECLKNNIHYVNTSLEDKNSPNQLKKKLSRFEQTYQQSHNDIATLKSKYKTNATNMLNCGMNPGCITIMTKLAILEIAKQAPKTQELNLYINDRDYARLCKYLEIEIIHCAEVDTIETPNANFSDTFYNTWCCQAFMDEYADSLQMTWGSEQNTAPLKSEMVSENVINMNKPSCEIYSESFCPKVGKYVGCCISHSEQISGGDYFSTPDHSPSIYYVYKFSSLCWNSVNRLNKKCYGGDIDKKTHVVNLYDDKITGIDYVGSLVIPKKYKAVWAGSILGCDNKNIGLHSPTTAQVAVSVLSFLHYALDNPKNGPLFAESVPENYFLEKIKPYFDYHIETVNYKPNLQFNKLLRTKKVFDAQF